MAISLAPGKAHGYAAQLARFLRPVLRLPPQGRCARSPTAGSPTIGSARLEGVGMVKRFDFGDGVARFELVTCDEHAHHHHLVCTCCADIVEIDVNPLMVHAKGQGVTLLDGRLVEVLHVRQALRVMAQAELIAQLEQS